MFDSAKKHLILLGVIALLFLAGTLSILMFIDPSRAGFLAFAVFYICLAIFCISVFTFVLYFVRYRQENLLHSQKLEVAGREAILLTALIIGSLLLSSRQLLYWWVELTFILFIFSIEAYFLI